MTKNANLKRRVRDRVAKTGESYTAARHHIVPPEQPAHSVLIGIAQTTLRPDPSSRSQLRESGSRVRELIQEAAAGGAALVHFPEGALTSPNKLVVSSQGPDVVAEADWTRVDWAALRAELTAVTETARELGVWVVVGTIDNAAGGPRPTNALQVISRDGTLTGRYDERMLSKTKSSFMYRAGTNRFIFEAGGIRFGCVAGMETQYPELFIDYERHGVDCVLLSTAGNPEHPEVFAIEAAGHAATNSYWVSYSGPAHTAGPPSGVMSPTGVWTARCVTRDEGIVLAEIDRTADGFAREWRRSARAATSLR